MADELPSVVQQVEAVLPVQSGHLYYCRNVVFTTVVTCLLQNRKDVSETTGLIAGEKTPNASLSNS
jgi:hypothetical protein